MYWPSTNLVNRKRKLKRYCNHNESKLDPHIDCNPQLMAEALPKNFIDYEEYPQTADIQNRCVSMIARLFNAPTESDDDNAMGTSSVGSSEAIMLATLAMKKRWQNKRKAEGKDYSRPNIIMSSAVQVVSLSQVGFTRC